MVEIEVASGIFMQIDSPFKFLKGFELFYNSKNGYAYVKMYGKRISVHRFVSSALPGEIIDHIDRNKLNNQINNLRRTTKAKNIVNSTKIRSACGYRGVVKNTGVDTYTARCGKIYLGSYRTPALAAIAYNRAAVDMYGEFAVLNTIKDDK